MPDLLEAEILEETPLETVEELEEHPDGTEHSEGDAKEGDGETKTPVTSLFQADGRKLDATVRNSLAKIKAEDPSVGKLLTKAVFRVAELDREFPGGLTEVRELRDKIEELGGLTGIQEKLDGVTELDTLAKQYMDGDPAFVEDMATSSPESFAALAPAVFAKYAEVNPNGFAAYIGRVVYADLQKSDIPLMMARLQDTLGDNPKANEVFAQLNSYLGGFKVLADKPIEAPKPKAAAAPKKDENSSREEELRSREWKIDRESLQRSITDTEYRKALAGRTAGTEDRAQIKELFLIRSKSAADRLFPGWPEKAQRFIKSGDRDGYLRYIKSIYTRVVPEAMASSVASTLKGARKPAAGAPPVPKKEAAGAPANGTQAAGTFKPVAAEPSTWEIDYNRTSTSMLRENRAFLKSGARVQWK